MKKLPIFIHSLFRAGSTYLFMVFQRSPEGYWCYQEALHEIAFFSRHQPQLLGENHGDSKVVLLRHPHLEKGYFHELQDVWPIWREKITATSIYAGYFAPPEADIGIPYWQSLVDVSKGRPVFQECRTPGRIGAIKESLGGYHIYLWRNPWDQWWSYKVSPYFDTANQLIIRAPHAPAPVAQLRKALGIEDEASSDISAAFAHYGSKPDSSEKSYLVFYMLWCLGLHEGMAHADLLLNIDRLSDSGAYRDGMQDALLNAGISGIDFSGCRVPQGRYLKQDQTFFEPLEERVHQWLLEGGWTPELLEQVQTIRQQYGPTGRSVPITSCLPADLAEQASRARALARRYETSWAENASDLSSKIEIIKNRATQAEIREAEARAQIRHTMEVAQQAQKLVARLQTRETELISQLQSALEEVDQAQTMAAQAEAHARDLSATLETTRQELHDVHQANHHHWQLSEARFQQILAMSNSTPWRLTYPLRWGTLQLRRLKERYVSSCFRAFARKLIRQIAYQGFDFVAKRPGLRTRCIAWAQKTGIYSMLHAYYWRHVFPASVCSISTESLQCGRRSCELEKLTPRARQIYADLKDAIMQQEKEKA